MFDFETLDKPLIRLSNSSPGNQCGTSWGGPKPGDPNTPAYLNAIPIPGGVELRWAYPSINPGAVSHTKVYRSRGNDFSQASDFAIAQGNSFVDFDFNGEQLEHSYWIQVVSIHNTEGTVVGPARAAALDSIGNIIDELSGRINDSHLAQALRSEIEKIPRIEWLESRINTEIADREFADLELVTQVESLTESVDDSSASIIEERGLRAEHDSALARAITELHVTMGDDLATVSTTLQAGITQNANSIVAIGQLIDEVKLEVDGDIAGAVSILNTAIEKERTDRGTAITALSQQVDQVELDLGDELAQGMQAITAQISTETGNRTESVRILTESINAVQAQLEGDVSSAIQSLTSQITAESDARTSAVNALSQAITDAQAQLEGDLAAAQAALAGQIDSVYDGLDKRVSANAAAVTKAQSELGGEIAQVETNLSTSISTVNDKVTDIGALYTAKVSVNGLIGGFGIYNDGSHVDAGFDVNTFWIGKDTLRKKPFIVEGSDVYIASAFIEDGSITNAKIGELAVGTANIQNGAITNAKIGTITADKIDTRGLTIKDSAGKVIFGAGNNLDKSLIDGLGSFASKSSITAGEVGGLGSLATKSSVTADNFSGSLPISKVSGKGAFATVNKILKSDSSTYIDTGALKMAMIGDLVVGSAHIADTIQSTNYSLGSKGWQIRKNGTARFYEDVYFGGELSAASGTFSGTLTASAVNAVKTINISGNSVTVHGSDSIPDGESTTANEVTVSITAGTGGYFTTMATIGGHFYSTNGHATLTHNRNHMANVRQWGTSAGNGEYFYPSVTYVDNRWLGAGTSVFRFKVPWLGRGTLQKNPFISLTVFLSMR